MGDHRFVLGVALGGAALVISACGGNKGDPGPIPAFVTVEPRTARYCCDPEAGFPQRAGTFRVWHGGPQESGTLRVWEAGAAGDPVLTMRPGETGELPLLVNACAPAWEFDYTIGTNPPFDHQVTIENACPERLEDPEDTGIGHPALDLIVVESARAANGAPWIAVTTRGGWRPPDSLYSWFVRFSVLNANGNTLYVCTVERHDGENSIWCPQGDVSGIEIRQPSTGPVIVFDAEVPDAERLRVESGVMPTENGPFTTDDAAGPLGTQVIAPPPGE